MLTVQSSIFQLSWLNLPVPVNDDYVLKMAYSLLDGYSKQSGALAVFTRCFTFGSMVELIRRETLT
jgi:hypothetical protein